MNATVFIPTQHGVVIMDLEDRLKYPGRIHSYHGIRKINIVTYYQGKTHHLHRLILGVIRKDLLVDHINGHRFDVRKKNLRAVKVATNNKNKADYKKTNNLPRGVRPEKNGKFSARITINKKTIYIGTFECPNLAHEEFKKEHRRVHGKNSVYNIRSQS